MTSQEIKQFVYNYLYDKGLPHKTIVATMGNITGESSWDTNLIEVGSGVGFGLCQWSYERRTQLEAYGTDLQHQCDFLWSELTGENTSATGASLQWISTPSTTITGGESYTFTLTNFLHGNGTIEELTKAFCYCWERPAYSTNHLTSIRIPSALDFNTTMNYTGTGNGSAEKVENAVQWMINIANDDTHGYDQNNRWGADYDCSSFIISAYEQAGIPVKTNGATYTGNMKSVFLASGFTLVGWNNDVNNLKRGDVLLNEIHHTACYIGNDKIVQASINENGTTTGGQTGDQTGKEIYIRDYYVYSSGWDCVLRFGDGSNYPTDPTDPTDPNDPTDPHKGEVYAEIEKTSYIINQLSTEQITFLKTLRFNDKVKLKYTFDRRKYNGVNFTGKRLTIDEKSYIIEDVENNGFIKLTTDLNNKCYKFVNPKLVKGVD